MNATMIMTEIAIENMKCYAESKLNKFAEKMPNGAFLNDHNYNVDKADAIVLLGSGDICPIFHRHTTCCLNPLYIDKDGIIHLSEFSCAGNVYRGDLEEVISNYNKGITDWRKNIIGAYEF